MIEQIKNYIQNKLFRVKNYIVENKSEFYLLIFILIVGAILRLYRIDEYMTFLGDEGRDVIVVRRLLVDFDPILVGPGTSIGNMYLGPLYYYMMALPLLFANFSPVGPAVMIALLSVFTIWFVWYVAREWFSNNKRTGETAGLMAASLYAVSTVVIRYSQSSWNPNIMPFFALLTIYSIWKVWMHYEWPWLVVAGISMAFVLQSHYLGLILIPIVGLFWLLVLIKKYKERTEAKKMLRYTTYGAFIFLFLMSPLAIFDARHGWRNFEAMKIFFTQRQTTVSARPWTAIPDLLDHLNQIVSTILTAGNEELGKIISYSFVLIFIVYLINLFKKIKLETKSKNNFLMRIINAIRAKNFAPYSLLFAWFIIALFGFGVYKQHIYAHYFGFLFPVPILIIAGASQYISDHFGTTGKLVVLLIFAFLILVNLSETPIKYPPNRQLQLTEEVARKIIEESNGNPLNLAVIAERNYEGAYQYFLEKEKSPILLIDPQRAEETVAAQLFVVCELPEEECDPVHHEKTEIANFGWSEIEDHWVVSGVNLYKLVPAEQNF